jgi:heat shock protein HslJ
MSRCGRPGAALRFGTVAAALLFAASCTADETVAAYGGADRVWTLTELDGAPFSARATLSFPDRGRIAGQAPCNRYFGTLTAPYPWFATDMLGSTKMACPDLAQEDAFFSALAAMTQAETLGNTLILRTDDGREMVFTASG